MRIAHHRLGGVSIWPSTLLAMLLAAAYLVTASACMTRLTAANNAKVMVRAQAALDQESDYDLAAQAYPATLKTIEGLWYVDQESERLLMLLAEGYCQYGMGFVEDDMESAEVARNLDMALYHQARATRMFIRCTNYGLRLLGAAWQEKLYTTPDQVKPLIAQIGMSQRNALMWTAVGLASTIHHNRDNVELLYHLPTAKAMLERVVELDDRSDNQDMYRRAMAHVALGMVHTALPESAGGLPKVGESHFRRALELTDGAFLLAKVLYAGRYAVLTQNRELYRKLLVEVLQVAPASWPERRLAGEIAHRRARRYLTHEAYWF